MIIDINGDMTANYERRVYRVIIFVVVLCNFIFINRFNIYSKSIDVNINENDSIFRAIKIMKYNY